ncbi:MAG: ROK family protein [Nitriliruptoraceae bacterium]
MRRHNLSAVLTQLHLAGPSSRSQLASHTGLNRSTIADLVEELMTLGLAEESGVATGPGPGRPSPIVRARPQSAAVLAIEVVVDSFAMALIGLGGSVLAERRTSRSMPADSASDVIDEIVRLAEQMLSQHLGSVVGVGVAVAGLTRRTDGYVHLAPNLGWRDVAVGELLRDTLGALVPPGTPIQVANEADLGALGEHRRGAGRGASDLLFISGEVGIGAGIISRGLPLLGTAGYAGEAGHMLIDPLGHQCACGARGCWEAEAGEHALMRRAGIPSGLHGHDAVGELLTRADQGEARAQAALEETGWRLGLGTGSLVNLFNPELVVFGGLYHRLLPWMEEPLRAGLASHALRVARELVTIVPSELSEDAVLVGAGELAFEGLLTDPAGVTPPAVSA